MTRLGCRHAFVWFIFVIGFLFLCFFADVSWPPFLVHPKRGETPLYWIDVLQNEDSFAYDDSRIEAANALAEIKPPAKSAIPALIHALGSRKPRFKESSWDSSILHISDLQDAARSALIQMGPSTIPALRKALINNDQMTRIHAAWALAELTDRTDESITVLLEVVSENQNGSREENVERGLKHAFIALGRKHPNAVVPKLIPLLNCKDDNTAELAPYILRHFGSDARAAAAPFLVDSLRPNRSPSYQVETQIAIGECGASALPALIDLLKNNNVEIRQLAAYTLMQFRMEDIELAYPALTEALNDPDWVVRGFVGEVLEALQKWHRRK
jgi:HEAT repeat protein